MQDDLRSGVLITPAQLAASPAGTIVLAVRNPVAPDHAAAARIPGAIDIDLPTALASPGGGTRGSRPLPDIATLQDQARKWGIREGGSVAVYDHDRGLTAARAWWVLRWAGVAGVRLLDGGFAAWLAAGLPVSHQPGSPAPGDVTLSAGHLPVLDAEAAAAQARMGVLLDTRIRPNYIGGHIPGAVSTPAMDALTEAGSFTTAATLRHLYAAHGVDGSAPVGVSCGAGISAAHTVAALASIGIEAAMFPGSWSAWSADPERPVATGAQPG